MILGNQKGLSLVEALLGATLAGIALVMAGQGLSGVMGVQQSLTTKRLIDAELSRALSDILKVGRVAQSCQRVSETIPATSALPEYQQVWLECRVDTNHPPTLTAAADTLFRFGLTLDGFQWL